MAISNVTAAEIVYGSDQELHKKVRGGMLRLARTIRDTTDGSESEARQRWARQVIGGSDSSYAAILRELSLKAPIQDNYATDDHTENTVKNQVDAVLDDAIAAQLG